MRQHDLGGDGVVIFFVLSGLLIAFAADNRREEGPALFAADRLSRLWSVAIPALLFCYLLDLIGQGIAPEIYAAVGYQGGVAWPSLLTGLTFTNEIWFASLQPGSNGPYWSLGYEAWYYAIFAGFFFAPRGWRWALAGALALAAGPKILLLAPSWILGVAVWRLIKSGRLNRLSRPMALTLAVFPVCMYVWLHSQSAHWALYAQTEALLGATWMSKLGFSDTFLWSAVLGVLTSVHILGMAALLAARQPNKEPTFEPLLRWLAGGSFALYLVHFPVMHFVGALLPGDVMTGWRQALLIIVPCLVAYLFAEASERRRPALRKWMRDRVQRKSRHHKSAAAASTQEI